MRNATKQVRYRPLPEAFHRLETYIFYRYHKLFYHSMIFRGRKAAAFKIFSEVKQQLKELECCDPLLVFFAAILKITPNIILFPIKKSGVIQGAPFPISNQKRITFAVKWVIKLLKSKQRVITVVKIVEFLHRALTDHGDSFDKKDAVHQVAYENRHLAKFFR